MIILAPLLEAFFLERLQNQRRASSNTIASYRDAFRLLLRFASERLGKPPSDLLLADLDAPLICAFLDYLETERNNSPRSRNARLAAIRSFFRFAALQAPEHSAVIQRVLAIPQKRFERKVVEFLTQEETDALLGATDLTTWIGRRDRALMLLAEQTGLRVSELTHLKRNDLELVGPVAHVRCLGKGRKQRTTPLRKETAAVLRAWLKEQPGDPSDPLFPSQRGGMMSRDAVEKRLKKYAALGRKNCSTLGKKRVSPHVLRHTRAVRMLEAGNDTAVIALWLGHDSPKTTHIYLAADLTAKERALAKTAPSSAQPSRYRPTDKLLAFLTSL
jgi:site-specific recombinase XerD